MKSLLTVFQAEQSSLFKQSFQVNSNLGDNKEYGEAEVMMAREVNSEVEASPSNTSSRDNPSYKINPAQV